MSQVNRKNNLPQQLKVRDLVKLLHSFLESRKTIASPEYSYQYNYNYLSPLAITDVEQIEIPGISVPIPLLAKHERPSLQWIASVITAVGIILANSSFVKNQFESTETLKEIASEIRERKNPAELKELVVKLESALKELCDNARVDERLQASRRQATRSNNILSEIEEDFHAIDRQIGQFLETAAHPFDSDEDSIADSLKQIVKYAAKLAELADDENATLESSPGSPNLDDYDKLFKVIDKPAIVGTFQQDEIFAYLQVAGQNPVMLEQFKGNDSRLPITEKQYQDIAAKFQVSDNLAEALAEGRLYVVDYTLLDGLVNGSYISQSLQQQKYLAAPVSLFAVPPANHPSRSLFPVAISYQKTTVSCDWVMFTPLDAGSEGEPWMTAKSITMMADSTYHEMISHLGRTHLVVEPFIVPTNNLPDNHPLKNLLQPHFEGTVLINYGAHAILVAPGGTVDSLFASSIGGDQSLAVKGAQSYLFNFDRVSFPQTLVSRGVMDANKLPTYPYRDDGLLIWNAIESWVSDYLSIYYSNDSAIQQDANLQKWASALASLAGGRLQNFGDGGAGIIETRDYLVLVVSTLIFIASAQHAAVNFPQEKLMVYVPAFPAARYLPAPTNLQDSESFIKGLPSISQAQTQINTLYLLGSVYYTQLGKYLPSAFPDRAEVQAALNKFQGELQNIESVINERNKQSDRLIAYEFLLPSRIPQSINI